MARHRCAFDIEPSAPAAERALSEQTRRHILLADDNADLRAYVSRLLRPTYDVTAVADGEQALRAALELRGRILCSRTS